MLPQEFLNRMQGMLGEQYPAFFESYERERYQSLRINPLKAEREEFLKTAPFTLSEVPWSSDGFYYGRADTPGKHAYHEAGVYYIQEASAMAPAEYLMWDYTHAGASRVKDAGERMQPAGRFAGTADAAGGEMDDERILDLCAAPGGKSTQIASAMRGRGLLVCNEIHPVRAKILSENVERMGIVNAMVTNETPERLAGRFSSYFTRILVDAPCSGEGMFRKNGEAVGEWSVENVALCAARQDGILDCAASMLAPGGTLVYSTCTFAPEENEGSILRFLHRHPEFLVQEVPVSAGMEHGVPAWADAAGGRESGAAEDAARSALVHTVRLWPHRVKGEGHFLAVLRKAGKLCGISQDLGLEPGIPGRALKVPGKGIAEYLEFAEQSLAPACVRRLHMPGTRYLRFGEQLYRIPAGMPAAAGLKILRPGLHLGTIKKGRFLPSHALALACRKEDVLHTLDFAADSREIKGYLSGGTFCAEGEKGWYLITADGYSVGWGRLAGGTVKNHYPKGLRKQLP